MSKGIWDLDPSIRLLNLSTAYSVFVLQCKFGPVENSEKFRFCDVVLEILYFNPVLTMSTYHNTITE